MEKLTDRSPRTPPAPPRRKIKERVVTEILADGTAVLMTKAEERKWRKSIKTKIGK